MPLEAYPAQGTAIQKKRKREMAKERKTDMTISKISQNARARIKRRMSKEGKSERASEPGPHP